MKRTYHYDVNGKTKTRSYQYIPVRYIVAVLITLLEVLAVIGIVVALCYFVPYFYLAAWVTEIVCVIRIASSDDNPDYKVPWLLVVLVIPIAGFMLYFLFYSRKLGKNYLRRLEELKKKRYSHDNGACLARLQEENTTAAAQAQMLCRVADTSLFFGGKQEYFSLGENMHKRILSDLESAEKFVYLEFFIVEDGAFWGSMLKILKQKAAEGVEVKLLYDDIGCMMTFPGNYYKTLKQYGIEALPFARLRGNADSEFNNRNHRKILVIDGKIGYTGGVNLADEYINEVVRFGHWKDIGVRLEGEAVWELTRLFVVDFGISSRKMPAYHPELYPEQTDCENGYVIPFGDGPNPLYTTRVSKSMIMNLLATATDYVWMTTPYLIIDNVLCEAIEQAAMRGVDVRIVVPHIPDKKIVFAMTRSFYPRLLGCGVRIYEYTPGFIHAKCYLSDDRYAVIGTVNLDYRSLVHHFENGVWMYQSTVLPDIKSDLQDTLNRSQEITLADCKTGLAQRAFRSVVRMFAPLL